MIVVPSLHPAFLLRSSEDAKGEASRFENAVVGDFKRAVCLTRRVPQWDERVIHEQDLSGRKKNIFPTAEEVIEFCKAAAGNRVTIDVEATGPGPMDCDLICVGLGFGEPGHERVICVPILKRGGGHYWDATLEPLVRKWLAWLLADPNTPKNGQNILAFDTIVLWRHGFPVGGQIDDTILAHHIVDAELPHGLDFLGSLFEEVMYWKGDAKGDGHFLDLDDTIFRIYNLRDVLVTHRIRPKLLDLVRKQQNEQLYNEELQQATIMAHATVRGLCVDKVRRDSTDPCSHVLDKKGRCTFCGELNPTRNLPIGLGPRMEIYKKEAHDNLCSMAGDPGFKPGSLPQLRRLFFERLGFPIVMQTEKGAPCLNKEVMVLLALHANTPEKRAALSNLVTWRRADKMLGTYVYGLVVNPHTGRLHVGWKVFGTVTGRFSSSPNQQNWNYLVKRLFYAPDGYLYVGIDLSQAELRGIGYLADDRLLLDYYEQDMNVHTINATLLFEIKNPGADTNDATEAYLASVCPSILGKQYVDLPVAPSSRWKEIRKLAKNFVFGDNYGAAADTLFTTLYSKLDSDTGEQMFPDLQPDTIAAMKQGWETLHPAIPMWWSKITNKIMKAGCYRSPYSGRIRWFRGGYKRNEMLNTPIQGIVADHMRRIVDIDRRMRVEAPGSAIVSQVHDALTAECLNGEVKIVGSIMKEELSRPFSLPGFPNARLPPDEPTTGKYYNEV